MPLDVLPPSTSTAGLTDAELRATAVPVSGPLTDTQIRATALPVSFSGDVTVVGKAAHDAAVSGNPILIGGYGSTATPSATSADGDVVRAWFDRSGRLQVGTELPDAVAAVDGIGPTAAPFVLSIPYLWTGSTGDLQQGKATGTLLASAAYTATQSGSGSPITSRTARGVIVYVYVSAVGTGTLTLNLCEKDPVFGQGLVVAAATVTASVGIYRASWCPGASGTGLGVILSASHPLPKEWYIVLSKSDASSWTFGASYTLVP